MAPKPNAQAFVSAHRARIIEELTAFLAIPSISTLAEHRPDIERTAEFLAAELRRHGIANVEICSSDGAPVVFGEWTGAPDKPTVLIYGHYDVQPVDPLDEWNSPPFEATVRGDKLYARGSTDMKGQIWAMLKALEVLVENGTPPVNLKFLFEGEEEIGSPNLEAFLANEKERFACDAIVNVDGGIHDAETPSITYGLRGMAFFELYVHGPKQDLHSGLFGGAVHNPLQALCELIAGMHDASGRIALPGYYDAVDELSAEERELLAQVPEPEGAWTEMTGAPQAWGEADYSITERIGARPTLEVNGLLGGFTAKGSKTVLPAKAMAKISMRLVPEQTPEAVERQLRAYLEEFAPPTITWELKTLAGAHPAVMDRDTPFMQAAVKALQTAYGKAPLFKRDGGTIPVVSLMKRYVGADTVMLGFELPDAQIHGPNEHLHLPTFFKSIGVYVNYLQML